MKKDTLILQYLLDKYTKREINKEEFDLLLTYFKDHDSYKDVEIFMDKDWETLSEEYPLAKSKSEELFQNILLDSRCNVIDHSKKNGIGIFSVWTLASATAAALIVLGIFLHYKSELKSKINTDQTQFVDIPAGGNRATLTLASGIKIVLNQNKEGLLIGDDVITYSDGSILEKTTEVLSSQSKTIYQTIETPKGGTYQITLSDGTKIWLNAASTLTYPSDLKTSKSRIVSLEGEAYFEVAKDKSRPFIVKSKNQTVKVLGTHFNISCYGDEKSVKTTLIEGSVEVNDVLLRPNEQSILTDNKIKVLTVAAEKSIAWKNGKFVFKSENLGSIMKKLARWYDVEIIVDGDISDKIFTGSISRYDNISKILEKISFTQAVKFKIEGRRIIIMP
ncbi:MULTISPECIES: FecR family protein [Sphingobacterium]|uniref:FecR family protein n=1 Tax=Sphingobacterium TaxID=28453 RepID=UPI0010DBA0CC|nr:MULTISPECIES: FecR family protein [Sphingobacterium]MCW2263079.1 hypothetical protein [Sphingobacterium kitahiroshimense]TCR11937.1 FecR family protein [Sphingobacterium sp. JUb78]